MRPRNPLSALLVTFYLSLIYYYEIKGAAAARIWLKSYGITEVEELEDKSFFISETSLEMF